MRKNSQPQTGGGAKGRAATWIMNDAKPGKFAATAPRPIDPQMTPASAQPNNQRLATLTMPTGRATAFEAKQARKRRTFGNDWIMVLVAVSLLSTLPIMGWTGGSAMLCACMKI